MLTITIQTEHSSDTVPSPADQVAEALAAIGFFRVQPRTSVTYEVGPAREAVVQPEVTLAPEPASDTLDTIKAKVDVAEDAPKRERGKPSPGRKRRTAEEVAEDEAATFEAAGPGMDDATKAAVDAEIAAEQQAISTGEERVGPEDTPEMVAQDAADEAAEADGGTIADMATLDDLRAAMTAYATKFGMPNTQIDGPAIMKAALGDLPAGATNPDGAPATAWRMSLVPEAQIGTAVAAWNSATAGNPYGREAVGG